jgi:hypothetical protein
MPAAYREDSREASLVVHTIAVLRDLGRDESF